MGGKRSREKGHRLERLIAKVFRDFGYGYAKTSRQASKLLDSCKIDLAFTPFLVQCKAGYKNNRPKYDIIFQEIKREINIHYPEEDKIHTQPIVLVHKLDGRGEENFTWTFSHDFITKLLKEYFKLKNFYKAIKSNKEFEELIKQHELNELSIKI